jgi:alkylation response protein AidB-like acyl-CoA dehydrogenase
MVDLKEAIGSGMEVRPIANMPGHETNEVFFDNLEIPAENLIGMEGRGFYHILDGLNAERTLIAGECIGDGYWFVDKACAYAGERIVFDRPIGQNQGVQFPIARWRPMPAGRRPMPASRRMAVLALRANTMSSASSARPGCIRWRQSRPT